MKTKGQRKSVERRIARRREKNRVNDSSVRRDATLGNVCMRGWCGAKVK